MSEHKQFCDEISGADTMIISILEMIADSDVWFYYRKESALFGRESELDSAEPELPEALWCDVRATSSLSSSFLYCAEVTEIRIAREMSIIYDG
jgi:hypothetical protein